MYKAFRRELYKSGCGAVGSLREKTIYYRFCDAKAQSKELQELSMIATHNDYATACSARRGARN